MTKDELPIITRENHDRISAILQIARQEIVELLAEELSRATIVPEQDLPSNVVSMNSTVKYKDMDSGIESTITLVYPPYADIDNNKISILTHVGSALIGLRVGQSISWPFPMGKEKQIKVVSVEYQDAQVS